MSSMIKIVRLNRWEVMGCGPFFDKTVICKFPGRVTRCVWGNDRVFFHALTGGY